MQRVLSSCQSGGIVSYIKFSTGYIIDNNNNKAEFTELRIVFEEYFEIKAQEGYVLKYLNFRIFHYPIGFSVDKNDHIM